MARCPHKLHVAELTCASSAWKDLWRLLSRFSRHALASRRGAWWPAEHPSPPVGMSRCHTACPMVVCLRDPPSARQGRACDDPAPWVTRWTFARYESWPPRFSCADRWSAFSACAGAPNLMLACKPCASAAASSALSFFGGPAAGLAFAACLAMGPLPDSFSHVSATHRRICSTQRSSTIETQHLDSRRLGFTHRPTTLLHIRVKAAQRRYGDVCKISTVLYSPQCVGTLKRPARPAFWRLDFGPRLWTCPSVGSLETRGRPTPGASACNCGRQPSCTEARRLRRVGEREREREPNTCERDSVA